jgi:hypothetical protein
VTTVDELSREAAKRQAAVEKSISEAPPLTAEQRDRIAALLRAGTVR